MRVLRWLLEMLVGQDQEFSRRRLELLCLWMYVMRTEQEPNLRVQGMRLRDLCVRGDGDQPGMTVYQAAHFLVRTRKIGSIDGWYKSAFALVDAGLAESFQEPRSLGVTRESRTAFRITEAGVRFVEGQDSATLPDWFR